MSRDNYFVLNIDRKKKRTSGTLKEGKATLVCESTFENINLSNHNNENTSNRKFSLNYNKSSDDFFTS